MRSQKQILSENNTSDSKTPETKVNLPTIKEFEELLASDTPLRSSKCDMNYSVYTKYSRSC